MPYDCKLIYRPGKDAENPADFLSRHPRPSDSELQNLAEDHVNYVCTTAVPKAMTLEDIKRTTKVDAEMQALIKVIPLKLFYYQTFFETWHNQHS